MRVVIDARLNAYRQGGIPAYTRQLLAALAQVAPDDQFIALQHHSQHAPLVSAPNVQRHTSYTPPHNKFEQWSLPIELLPTRADVIHAPDFIAPLRRACPAVVTVHDLAFLHYPEILDADAQAFYGQLPRNIQRADAIITVSEHTRRDIVERLQIAPERIDLVYEAAAPFFAPISVSPGETRQVNEHLLVAGSFVLFVSTIEPRKNLPTLFAALRRCIDLRPDAGYRLVVAGHRGWRDGPIFQAVRDLDLGEYVDFVGGVSNQDLRWLYNACRLYVNPSLYEGFGLPLLEALTCGVACLAADSSSLPEIGGNAARFVPALDVAAWSDAIANLWDDDEQRAHLGRLGFARAAQFSWPRAARETLAIYRRLARK